MKETKQQPAHPLNAKVAYEKRDLNAFYIASIGVAILVSALIIHVTVSWLYKSFDASDAHRGRLPITLVNGKRPTPPEPRLQIDPTSDLRQLRIAEDAKLRSYGWIDRQNGIVRIPIDEAMKLIIARGLPSAKPVSTPAKGVKSKPANVKSPGSANTAPGSQR